MDLSQDAWKSSQGEFLYYIFNGRGCSKNSFDDVVCGMLKAAILADASDPRSFFITRWLCVASYGSVQIGDLDFSPDGEGWTI